MLVTGAGGMVGREVVAAAREDGWDTIGCTHADLDVTDRRAVRAALSSVTPDLVLNAAAYTQVDTAEDEAELARRVNAEGPAALADACAAGNTPLIHLSTDYVFDGRSRRPYRPEDSPHPLSVYGRTKWQGEEAVRERLMNYLIVRTSWVFAPHGNNFLRTIAQLAREQETLYVVADQHGCPTLATDLARALLAAARLGAAGDKVWGTYHFCNAGETTRFELASTIVAGLRSRMNLVCKNLVPIATSDRPTRALRPAYSVLDTSSWVSTFGFAPRPWKDALSDALWQLN